MRWSKNNVMRGVLWSGLSPMATRIATPALAVSATAGRAEVT